MSKRNRSQRRADTQKYQKKQLKLARAYGYENLSKEQVGRMKHRSHLDCGTTNCSMCRSDRKNDWVDGKNSKLTMQEKRKKDEYEATLYGSGSSYEEEGDG